MNPKKIKAALAFVHYWEDRERGPERRPYIDAFHDAVRYFLLTAAETQVLRNALNIPAPRSDAGCNCGMPGCPNGEGVS
jgi:hypothetical protein